MVSGPLVAINDGRSRHLLPVVVPMFERHSLLVAFIRCAQTGLCVTMMGSFYLPPKAGMAGRG